MNSFLEIPEIRHRVTSISVEQYHQLFAAGIIPEKTELLEGVIFDKMPKSPRHTKVVGNLFEILQRLFPMCFVIRKEEPLTISDSEPEPELALVRGTREDINDCHPSTAQLVIEVSFSTLTFDTAKKAIYAKAEIPEMWIVDVRNSQIIKYENPLTVDYRMESVFHLVDSISIGENSVSVADIFK